jgi:hypothetical protein
MEQTYKSKRGTLGLFLSTKLEADPQSEIYTPDSEESTHCLQRLRDICILYLHTVHSNRKTTFFVVFA